MEYKITGFRKNDLVKLEIRINGEPADALSVICHRDNSYRMGKQLVSKLKELIPRQMFKWVGGARVAACAWAACVWATRLRRVCAGGGCGCLPYSQGAWRRVGRCRVRGGGRACV